MEATLSIVVAVYNRSDELRDLLYSLVSQRDTSFEVVVVDDGSWQNLELVINEFSNSLNIKYLHKENQGAALARNFGVEHCGGEWLVFLDSDCTVNEDYVFEVKKFIKNSRVSAFGGCDMADKKFTDLQKAISYAMTSKLTTGGIRGDKNTTDFQLRSFNMVVKRDAFHRLGGFDNQRIGEDIDFCMRLWSAGYVTAFAPHIGVVHKRRTTWRDFARRVYQFGEMRPILEARYPAYKRWIFSLPSLFVLGFILGIGMPFYVVYFLLILFDSTAKNRSFLVGVKSVFATIIQFFAYGLGYAKSLFIINILGKNETELQDELE